MSQKTKTTQEGKELLRQYAKAIKHENRLAVVIHRSSENQKEEHAKATFVALALKEKVEANLKKDVGENLGRFGIKKPKGNAKISNSQRRSWLSFGNTVDNRNKNKGAQLSLCCVVSHCPLAMGHKKTKKQKKKRWKRKEKKR